MSKSLKEHSRTNYTYGQGMLEEVSAGCLQRIADACELMALNYGRLIIERDTHKRFADAAIEREEATQRQLSAAKGRITKLKKRIEELEATK